MPPIKQLQCLTCYMVSIFIVLVLFTTYSLFKVGQFLYVKNQ